MEIVKAMLAAVLSIAELFLLIKWIGNRQMSQLTMFEYINGITIGSIAAEMALAEDTDHLLEAAVTMLVYAAIGFGLSLLTDKSIACRRIITGRSRVLFADGKLYRNNFKKSHMDFSEFQVLCRNAGYFNLADLQCAILEPNGKISFLPKSEKRPATPEDLSLTVQPEHPVSVVIMDGRMLQRNMKACGIDENWIQKQLKQQGVSAVKDVCLATVDDTLAFSVYQNYSENAKGDRFQ